MLAKKIKNYKVQITDGTKTDLKKLSGPNGLILFFYPRDNTPGCTTEACSFRDNLNRLDGKGFAVVGVSGDSVSSHQKFSDKKELNFPLISDPEFELCNVFGVYGLKKFMGKEHMGINRRTFVLNANLKVILEYPKVKVKEHVEQILRDLDSI